MIEIGRICVKLAGRDGGREAVIVDILDSNYVLIDGNVRRRKCNIFHLEPTSKKIEIKRGASHEDVKAEFSKLKISVWETKPKEKTTRPRKVKKKKVVEEPKKKAKKVQKEEKPKKEAEKKPIDAKVVSVRKNGDGPVVKKEEKTETKKPANNVKKAQAKPAAKNNKEVK
ncbi:MAG: 50S ribosomal protein L14e [Nanoarchaeota archaeon]|nr:50S ribosomal protein L14e [Nanoarchaeota archaeon]